MNDLTDIFNDVILIGNINLPANALTNDILRRAGSILRKNTEGRCISEGYINKIYSVLSIDRSIMRPENFTGNTELILTYSAQICNPIRNTFIVAKVESIDKGVIKAYNGPILCIIPFKYINSNNFAIVNSTVRHIHTNTALSYVKLKISNINMLYNDRSIGVICSLDDIVDVTTADRFMHHTNINADNIEDIINYPTIETNDI